MRQHMRSLSAIVCRRWKHYASRLATTRCAAKPPRRKPSGSDSWRWVGSTPTTPICSWGSDGLPMPKRYNGVASRPNHGSRLPTGICSKRRRRSRSLLRRNPRCRACERSYRVSSCNCKQWLRCPSHVAISTPRKRISIQLTGQSCALHAPTTSARSTCSADVSKSSRRAVPIIGWCERYGRSPSFGLPAIRCGRDTAIKSFWLPRQRCGASTFTAE